MPVHNLEQRIVPVPGYVEDIGIVPARNPKGQAIASAVGPINLAGIRFQGEIGEHLSWVSLPNQVMGSFHQPVEFTVLIPPFVPIATFRPAAGRVTEIVL